jgi:hypothetical protein
MAAIERELKWLDKIGIADDYVQRWLGCSLNKLIAYRSGEEPRDMKTVWSARLLTLAMGNGSETITIKLRREGTDWDRLKYEKEIREKIQRIAILEYQRVQTWKALKEQFLKKGAQNEKVIVGDNISISVLDNGRLASAANMYGNRGLS